MKTFRERLKEGAFGSVQMISTFVFVVLVGLITLYAVAEKKNEPFNAFVSAVGAFGQVAIALLVYRLSERQFLHTQRVTDRQARIEAYAYRSELITSLEEWGKKGFIDVTRDSFLDLLRLLMKVHFVFGDETIPTTATMEHSYSILVNTIDDFAKAKRGKSTVATIMTFQAQIEPQRKDAIVQFQKLLNLLHAELRLDVPTIPSSN